MIKSKDNKKMILVENSYFEYVTEENGILTWKQLDIEGLPFIPVIVTADVNKNNNRILYYLSYELPYTHESIATSSIETFITEIIDKDDKTHTTQIKMPNKEYDTLETPIRLDNQNIDMSKKMLESNDIAYEYIKRKKRHIFNLIQLLDESAAYLLCMQKKLKK